jgi:putative restriction endonuclease
MIPPLDKAALINQIESINVWGRGTERAPHKPLLLLLALASLQRGEARQQPYGQIEEKLRHLLEEFGPSRRNYHPEYPFWRLQNDGDFWEIPQRNAIEAGKGRDVVDKSAAILRTYHATGGFAQPIYAWLRSDPTLVQRLVSNILHAHFPPSLHEPLLDAVNMPLAESIPVRVARDPNFWRTILRIYEHRCAVCGFDGRLGNSSIAINATHVKWAAAGGPDSEENGLALCVLHHRLFERGAIGMDDSYRVLVSQHLHGGTEVMQRVFHYAGTPLRQPQPGSARIAEEYIAWHYSEVFRHPEQVARG